jgi:hypothetical protein
MDISYFYNYGNVELRDEIKQDIMVGLLTDKRSMYYYRDYGAGIMVHENDINNVIAQILMRYDIVIFMARRNREVSNGSSGYRDRRAVTSQSVIDVYSEGNESEVSVDMVYIPMFDMLNKENVTVKMGGAQS